MAADRDKERFYSFPKLARTLASLLALSLALGAAGCKSTSVGDITGTASNDLPPPGSDEGRLRAYAEDLAPRYAAHPDDRKIAMNYATALRRLTQHAQAVAVLQRLAVKYPQDMTVLGAYGKALADAGRLQEASSVLERSHTPDRPNWTILSAQGSVADQMGDHRQAQAYYAAALKIVPNQPQVLSNLGLSYALEHQMPLAERTLRDAAAQPAADIRVRQNLALVLSMEGRYADAEDVVRRDMSPIDASESVYAMRHMIGQSDTWRPAMATSRKVASRGGAKRTQTASVDGDR